MRFCSRCGFALAGVAMLVENDGVLPAMNGTPAKKLPLPRKKVIAESAIFTAICWAVVIVATAMFNWGGPFESLAKIAALLFFILGLIGLLRFLYGFLFVKDLVNHTSPQAFSKLSEGGVLDVPRRAELPAQRDWAPTDFPRRENTQEIVARPSVTENTTRLLRDPPTERSD
jgi:hypothetical protein